MCKSGSEKGIFDYRCFCDQFIRSLIQCQDLLDMQLYGFVLLSNQVHLILEAAQEDVHSIAAALKERSSKEILQSIRKSLDEASDKKDQGYLHLRKIFSCYLNMAQPVLWKSDTKYLELSVHRNGSSLEPINQDVLHQHLANEERNYLQLGAKSFTNLMMKTMRC